MAYFSQDTKPHNIFFGGGDEFDGIFVHELHFVLKLLTVAYEL